MPLLSVMKEGSGQGEGKGRKGRKGPVDWRVFLSSDGVVVGMSRSGEVP